MQRAVCMQIWQGGASVSVQESKILHLLSFYSSEHTFRLSAKQQIIGLTVFCVVGIRAYPGYCANTQPAYQKNLIISAFVVHVNTLTDSFLNPVRLISKTNGKKPVLNCCYSIMMQVKMLRSFIGTILVVSKHPCVLYVKATCWRHLDMWHH